MKSSKKTASTQPVSTQPVSTRLDQENTVMKATKKKSAAHVTVSSTPTDQENTAMKTATAVATSSALPAAIAATGTIDAVPAGAAPAPPTDFVSSNLGRLVRPLRSQVNLALKMATEIRGCTSYTTLFGGAAPDPIVVANALTVARGWSDKLSNAEAWYRYVKEQDSLAWRQAIEVSAPLRIPLEMTVARDASVAETLPSTVAFFAAGTDRAAKGVATRKRKAAAEKAKQAATAAPAPAEATTAPTTH